MSTESRIISKSDVKHSENQDPELNHTCLQGLTAAYETTGKWNRIPIIQAQVHWNHIAKASGA